MSRETLQETRSDIDKEGRKLDEIKFALSSIAHKITQLQEQEQKRQLRPESRNETLHTRGNSNKASDQHEHPEVKDLYK
jgi:hypothetical protein